MGSATAAPTKVVVQTSIVRDHAVTRVGTGTSVTVALPTARRVSIVVAAVARVQARVLAARTHRRMLIIRAKAQSMPTTAAGSATRDTIKAAVSVTAARISRAVPTSIARVHVTILVAMDTSATAAQPIARRVSIVVAAVAPARAHAQAAQMRLRMRRTLVRDQSI